MAMRHVPDNLFGLGPVRRLSVLRVRRHAWPVIALLLLGIGLLAALRNVIAQSVTDGDLRRRASAAQADATWRCKLLRQKVDRLQCLQQVGAVTLVTAPAGPR